MYFITNYVYYAILWMIKHFYCLGKHFSQNCSLSDIWNLHKFELFCYSSSIHSGVQTSSSSSSTSVSFSSSWSSSSSSKSRHCKNSNDIFVVHLPAKVSNVSSQLKSTMVSFLLEYHQRTILKCLTKGYLVLCEEITRDVETIGMDAVFLPAN